jgi:hypothetical protein
MGVELGLFALREQCLLVVSVNMVSRVASESRGEGGAGGWRSCIKCTFLTCTPRQVQFE